MNLKSVKCRNRIAEVRKLLRQNPDGLTTHEISEMTQIYRGHLSRILNKMPDAYIDRWVMTSGSRRWMRAVWCVVVPPENCPRPGYTRKEKTK